jgi:hypothetical protein
MAIRRPRRGRAPLALSIRELRLHPEVRLGDLTQDPTCPCGLCRSSYKMYYENAQLLVRDTHSLLRARLLLLAVAR